MKKRLPVMLTALALSVAMAFALAACVAVPKDYASAKKNLEDSGYVVGGYDFSNASGLELIGKAALEAYGLKGLTGVISGTNGDEFVAFIFFDSAKEAKDAWKNFEDKAEEFAGDYDNDKKEEKSDYKAGISGKVIYVGTKQALKDAK
jgi:hypothetical protein